jgi:hypothetical protein
MTNNMDKISVLKPKLSDKDVEKIVKNANTWIMGLIPPRNFQIEATEDIFIPYILTGVCYYKKISQKRRCYVFSNLDQGIRSGVVDVDNLEFVEADRTKDITPIDFNEEAHVADIAHYCIFDLLVKNYRKYINWKIDILEIQKMYRIKRVVWYTVNGKPKTKEIYLDSMILK